MSIYYYVKALEPVKAPLRTKEFDFDEQQLNVYKSKQEVETFRFIDWDRFSSDCVTLPIDKMVATMIKKEKN
jgi:hypothetical protein